MHRGRRNRRLAGDEGVVPNNTTMSKFGVPMDPFEQEQRLAVITPKTEDQRQAMLDIVDGLLAQDIGEEKKKALEVWKVQLSIKDIENEANAQFAKDFWSWLLGRGKEEDHVRTEWGRQALTDDSEVRAYVDSFYEKRWQFLIALQMLKMRRPKGILQTYLYFKYVVRGKAVTDDEDFLADWKMFMDQNKTPPGTATLKPGGPPHETYPYGDTTGQNEDTSARKNAADGLHGEQGKEDDSINRVNAYRLHDAIMGRTRAVPAPVRTQETADDSDLEIDEQQERAVERASMELVQGSLQEFVALQREAVAEMQRLRAQQAAFQQGTTEQSPQEQRELAAQIERLATAAERAEQVVAQRVAAAQTVASNIERADLADLGTAIENSNRALADAVVLKMEDVAVRMEKAAKTMAKKAKGTTVDAGEQRAVASQVRQDAQVAREIIVRNVSADDEDYEETIQNIARQVAAQFAARMRQSMTGEFNRITDTLASEQASSVVGMFQDYQMKFLDNVRRLTEGDTDYAGSIRQSLQAISGIVEQRQGEVLQLQSFSEFLQTAAESMETQPLQLEYHNLQQRTDNLLRANVAMRGQFLQAMQNFAEQLRGATQQMTEVSALQNENSARLLTGTEEQMQGLVEAQKRLSGVMSGMSNALVQRQQYVEQREQFMIDVAERMRDAIFRMQEGAQQTWQRAQQTVQQLTGQSEQILLQLQSAEEEQRAALQLQYDQLQLDIGRAVALQEQAAVAGVETGMFEGVEFELAPGSEPEEGETELVVTQQTAEEWEEIWKGRRSYLFALNQLQLVNVENPAEFEKQLHNIVSPVIPAVAGLIGYNPAQYFTNLFKQAIANGNYNAAKQTFFELQELITRRLKELKQNIKIVRAAKIEG